MNRFLRGRVLLSALSGALLLGSALADELPAPLVGTWASADSEFNGGQLAGGNALYLAANGRGALLGAPLPVQHCADDPSKVCAPHVGVPVQVHFEAASSALRLSLAGSAKDVLGSYQAGPEAVIVLSTPAGPLRLLHHSLTVPPALASMLTPQSP